MNTTYKCLFSVLIFSLCSISFSNEIYPEFKGEWSGIEVMGVDQSTAEIIRKLVPIKKGDPFSSAENNKFKQWCSNIKINIAAKDVHCSFIGYENRQFFYNIEVTPNNEKEYKFRHIPKTSNNTYKVPETLKTLLSKYDNRFFAMMAEDNFPHEIKGKRYADYHDPELHALVQKLIIQVKKNNQKILNILRFSNDEKEREKAAQLLAWSTNDNNLAYILKWDLFNDPDPGVRNDLSRSIYRSLDYIKDKNLINRALPIYCEQAALRSHTDRNKALSSIQKILRKHPDLYVSIDNECIQTIQYIADTSILINSGGIAKDILNSLEKSPHV